MSIVAMDYPLTVNAVPEQPCGKLHLMASSRTGHTQILDQPETESAPWLHPAAKRLLPPLILCFAKLFDLFGLSGAGDGDRTRDVQLGKLAFYR
jgi:hypothetical protein